MDIKKVIAKLPTGYADEVASLTTEAIEAEVLQCETNIIYTKKEMKADAKLNGAKDLVKDLSAGYREVFKTQNAKIEYLMHVREERGQGTIADGEAVLPPLTSTPEVMPEKG